ncbi:ATP-binding protein [Herbidospora cretacea]|uniref:ATP-binding protein n=1 Tax=Herbidospora cretacea TaxID=28444 RepID=UPI000773609A|nr:FtsK/SpoIIIE domain-containing protein [Herbidospora cretacea]
MTADPVSTAAVDYLQRARLVPPLSGVPGGTTPFDARRVVRVAGAGEPLRAPAVSSTASEDGGRAGSSPELPILPLLVGLAGARAPVAFLLDGQDQNVSVRLGTWAQDGVDEAGLDARQATLLAVLDGCYPALDLAAAGVAASRLPYGALGLGVPSPPAIDPRDGALPVDRLVRSMNGLRWAALVLATPADGDTLGADRNLVLNEMRSVASAVEATGVASPLAEHYLDMLRARLEALADAQARGGWRTAVYLFGERAGDLAALSAAWRAVHSGVKSLPEPVRTVAHPLAAELGTGWALPDAGEQPGPNLYRHPFGAQTLLSSAQLAAYVHLPNVETPGFAISPAPRFDTVVPSVDDRSPHLVVGEVMQHLRTTGGAYRVPLRSLTRHVFVPGTTGAGKTNTIMGLLLEAASHDVPFMVIEPAKTEYRALIGHPALGRGMQIFTAGKAMVAPFVLNPFEVPPGTTVGEHLDLLRAVFMASFGMWTPLPQILERCLHEIYLDRGWDLRTNENTRLGESGPDATSDVFPTLSDLVAKVGEVIPALGYDDRIAGDMRASLLTRLESLRRGAKGAMLDVAGSLPPQVLFERPTVVELDALGDEGDKAFFAGLLLIRLVEHRRARGQSQDLTHLLVVEEAHRLLANVPAQSSEESANPRGQAVETFSNLLSEIRAYGQGVIIADQIPVRLAPDVIKNTNLKIAHRIISADDRVALAGAMAMDEPQAKALTTLRTGQAVVFSGGEDAPLMVRVPPVKDALAPQPPPDAQVREHMARWREEGSFAPLFLSRPFCGETCAAPPICDAARALAADTYAQRVLSRLVTSAIDDPGAFDRLWDDLTAAVRARRPSAVPDEELLRAFAGHGADWLATRRGIQGAWTYADTAEFRDRLRALLLDRLDAAGRNTAALIDVFRQTVHRLSARRFEPYPACHLVCAQDPPLCLYRSAVADLVAGRRYRTGWLEADHADASSEDKRRRQTWEVCQDAAYEMIEFPAEDMPEESRAALDIAARRVCLCFQQQMLADDDRKAPRTIRRILARVMGEAGL